MELEAYKKEIQEMNDSELEEEYKNVNMYIFMIDMIDKWSENDRITYNYLNDKNKILEEEINERNKH